MGDKSKLKGKNFNVDEERQLCKSYINVFEDPMVGIGHKAKAFWERVSTHYNQHLLADSIIRIEHSLGSKFGEIKADVAKFVGVHASVETLNESGTIAEYVLEKSHNIFKVKNKKAFKYLHCWEILRIVLTETRRE